MISRKGEATVESSLNKDDPRCRQKPEAHTPQRPPWEGLEQAHQWVRDHAKASRREKTHHRRPQSWPHKTQVPLAKADLRDEALKREKRHQSVTIVRSRSKVSPGEAKMAGSAREGCGSKQRCLQEGQRRPQPSPSPVTTQVGTGFSPKPHTTSATQNPHQRRQAPNHHHRRN